MSASASASASAAAAGVVTALVAGAALAEIVPTLISGREFKLAEIGLYLLILLARVSENVKLLRLRALTTITIKRRRWKP